jgi:predicted nuclease of predicted toxin-antitoxin system
MILPRITPSLAGLVDHRQRKSALRRRAIRSVARGHTRRPRALAEASDRQLWDYAKANGFTLVSLDSDFADMGSLARIATEGHLVAMR